VPAIHPVGRSSRVRGCSSTTATSAAPVTLTIWHHVAERLGDNTSDGGTLTERTILVDQIRRFNASQHKITVNLVEVQQEEYNHKVQLAVTTGNLPDVFEFDGPNLENYVYQGKLHSLEGLLSQQVRSDLSPSVRAQGTYQGHLYSVGAIDSGLGLWADGRALKAAGVRIPTSPADAWTSREFTAVLKALAAHDPDGKVLNLALNYGKGEWYTYGFSPVVWSAGGSLGKAPGFGDATGTLATPAVAGALELLQTWTARYVEPGRVGDKDPFVEGRTSLSWVGHWAYPDYHAKLGDNLVLLPLPDFGFGTKTGSGTWNWGVAANTAHPAEAAQFLDFLMSTPEVLAMGAVTGAPPATSSALAASPLYSSKGPLALFAEQLSSACGIAPQRSCVAVTRPATAAYPVITAAFQDVMTAVFTGGDVRTALAKAAATIDADYKANDGYALVP